MIEENTIVGNTSGIFLAAGVQGNIFRSNLVVGNPGVQVSVDHPSNNGFDIQNLASPGANSFEGNTCETALNAPCPSVGPSMTASPNPIPVAPGAMVGQTEISWNAPDAQVIEIHIGSPSGQLFTNEGNRGTIQTGIWVADGLTFYMQDVTGGKPLTSDYTLATLVVHLQTSTTNGMMPFPFRMGRLRWVFVTPALIIGLGLACIRKMPRRRRLPLAISGTAALVAAMVLGFPENLANAQSHSAQQTTSTLDRMVAAGKTPPDLAQYVFDSHGCKSCHTLGQNGKLGFTSKGQQTGANFEGCIRLLTDMSQVVKVAESQRSVQQRAKAARFQEFGCTFCHKPSSGKIELTEVGAKLSHLHLGCVEIEKNLAAGRPQQR